MIEGETNKIILALDNEIEEGLNLVEKIENNKEISDMLYGYKLSSLWILEEGLNVVQELYLMVSSDHAIILDMQKWPTDVYHIVKRQVEKVADAACVDELIACPMGGGKKSFETFVNTCSEHAIKPICVIEMTHEDCNSYLAFSSYMNILIDAINLGVKSYLIPSTKEIRHDVKDVLKKYNVDADLYSTGFKIQLGEIKPMINFGVKKFIVGRGIYNAESPINEISHIYNEINGIKI